MTFPLKYFRCLILLAIASVCASSQAANTPCSGRKGGISHCAGDTFVCNDGSISASKRSCAAYTGQRGTADMRKNLSGGTSDCSCRSHTYCVGPRGGEYCFTDSGKKSYRRR